MGKILHDQIKLIILVGNRHIIIIEVIIIQLHYVGMFQLLENNEFPEYSFAILHVPVKIGDHLDGNWNLVLQTDSSVYL